MTDFGLNVYLPAEGKLVISTPRFDFDTFPPLGERLLQMLSATVIEKQWDADIHTWLVDFEGCKLLMKAEHYSETVWFECLDKVAAGEELHFLAGLFEKGF
ncbi:DUF3630 family protein [Vibrio sp. ZSDZ34]|uniref:DUF3630 family protein n=1 Tax=Vibrio gelatinilyticus TaxID=2893468 RepID=A0A9X1WE39_9VIBR|nr:DUF3630 family protein [Vibrio gelatinilyticus]MCJ2378903.1 DUF3630 family protein [Vibrio gelatinilyticus]